MNSILIGVGIMFFFLLAMLMFTGGHYKIHEGIDDNDKLGIFYGICMVVAGLGALCTIGWIVSLMVVKGG